MNAGDGAIFCLRKALRLGLAALLLHGLTGPHTAFADTTFPGDFFLFPAIKASVASGPGFPPGIDNKDTDPNISMFYSYEKDDFLVLVEYFINNHENEFERLQLGWGIDKHTRLWFGRVHNPLGYWNTAFHHGSYLQTSISRPGITEFEHDGGVLPIHLSGLLVDKDVPLEEGRFSINVAIGAGPTLENGELEAMDIASPGGETYHENYTVRLSYYPQTFENSHVGVFTGFSRIEGDGVLGKEMEQTQSGVYGLMQVGDLQLLGSAFFIENTLKPVVAGPDSSYRFTSAYAQIEYKFNERWTAFTRAENSKDHDNDPFLASIPSFVDERQLIGFRFDFFIKHALTLEYRQDHVSAGDIDYAVIQWSALLP